MPLYLLQVAYNNDGWAALVKNPHDRAEAVRPAIEKLGGRIESFYYAFGESDVVAVVRMPDNVTAAAFSIAVAGGNTVKSIRTTPLMTQQEGVEAMRKAGGSAYRPATATRGRAASAGRTTRRK